MLESKIGKGTFFRLQSDELTVCSYLPKDKSKSSTAEAKIFLEHNFWKCNLCQIYFIRLVQEIHEVHMVMDL